jgi:hypothetical protein
MLTINIIQARKDVGALCKRCMSADYIIVDKEKFIYYCKSCKKYLKTNEIKYLKLLED